MVQLTPKGFHGLHLVVNDIEAARAELVGRGVDVSEPFLFGAAGQASGLDPERRSYATFMAFNDPDGDTWLVQEVKRDWRLQMVKIDAEADA